MPRLKGDTTNKPAPLAVQNLFDSLGLLPCATIRLSLWQDLERFHEDPLYEYRKYMTLSQNREEIRSEVHNFLRQYGNRYFSKQYLEPGVAVYDESSSTEEISTAYEPLFHALLYLCRRANQKRNQERNKRDWKQWEAVRNSLNPASTHDNLGPRDITVVDDDIFAPQSDSDLDYVPPKRHSNILSNHSSEASPEYIPSQSRQTQVDPNTGHRQSARTVSRKQKAALYSRLQISSDDAEPRSSPSQASRVRPASQVLVLKLPKLPPNQSILESGNAQLSTGSLQDTLLTRGAATKLASLASNLLPTLDPEKSTSPVYEGASPLSQRNCIQSSHEGACDPDCIRLMLGEALPSSRVESPARESGIPPGSLPSGSSSRSPTRNLGTETQKKRRRNDSTGPIPENQGGPAKFNSTIRHRISLDHAKSYHTHHIQAIHRQPGTTTTPGEPTTEPCGRTFTPINTEHRLQELVPSNDGEATVLLRVVQSSNHHTITRDTVPNCNRQLMEPTGLGPLEIPTATQQNAQPSTHRVATLEDEALGKETTSGPMSAEQAAQTEGTPGDEHKSSTPKSNVPQSKRVFALKDWPKRKIKMNILLENKEGMLVPWSYGKLSETTPKELIAKIAKDVDLPPEQIERIRFVVKELSSQQDMILDNNSVRPIEKLKSMVTEWSKVDKASEICDVIAIPIICGDVDCDLDFEE